MKFVSILLALLLITFLVVKKINSGTSDERINEVIENKNIEAPRVPTSPKDIPKFEEDINNFIQDNAKERARKLESKIK